MSTDAKLCRICGPKRGPLPLSAFWHHADSPGGYRAVCSSCERAKRPTRRKGPIKPKLDAAALKLVFSLHKEGLTHKEIGERIGRSRQTISGIIYRADPSKKPKPRTHPKSAVPKPDDDHPSKQSWGKAKPGDPLWPVEEARQRDLRALKNSDERRKRLRAEWLSYRI